MQSYISKIQKYDFMKETRLFGFPGDRGPNGVQALRTMKSK